MRERTIDHDVARAGSQDNTVSPRAMDQSSIELGRDPMVAQLQVPNDADLIDKSCCDEQIAQSTRFHRTEREAGQSITNCHSTRDQMTDVSNTGVLGLCTKCSREVGDFEDVQMTFQEANRMLQAENKQLRSNLIKARKKRDEDAYIIKCLKTKISLLEAQHQLNGQIRATAQTPPGTTRAAHDGMTSDVTDAVAEHFYTPASTHPMTITGSGTSPTSSHSDQETSIYTKARATNRDSMSHSEQGLGTPNTLAAVTAGSFDLALGSVGVQRGGWAEIYGPSQDAPHPKVHRSDLEGFVQHPMTPVHQSDLDRPVKRKRALSTESGLDHRRRKRQRVPLDDDVHIVYSQPASSVPSQLVTPLRTSERLPGKIYSSTRAFDTDIDQQAIDDADSLHRAGSDNKSTDGERFRQRYGDTIERTKSPCNDRLARLIAHTDSIGLGSASQHAHSARTAWEESGTVMVDTASVVPPSLLHEAGSTPRFADQTTHEDDPNAATLAYRSLDGTLWPTDYTIEDCILQEPSTLPTDVGQSELANLPVEWEGQTLFGATFADGPAGYGRNSDFMSRPLATSQESRVSAEVEDETTAWATVRWQQEISPYTVEGNAPRTPEDQNEVAAQGGGQCGAGSAGEEDRGWHVAMSGVPEEEEDEEDGEAREEDGGQEQGKQEEGDQGEGEQVESEEGEGDEDNGEGDEQVAGEEGSEEVEGGDEGEGEAGERDEGERDEEEGEEEAEEEEVGGEEGEGEEVDGLIGSTCSSEGVEEIEVAISGRGPDVDAPRVDDQIQSTAGIPLSKGRSSCDDASHGDQHFSMRGSDLKAIRNSQSGSKSVPHRLRPKKGAGESQIARRSSTTTGSCGEHDAEEVSTSNDQAIRQDALKQRRQATERSYQQFGFRINLVFRNDFADFDPSGISLARPAAQTTLTEKTFAKLQGRIRDIKAVLLSCLQDEQSQEGANLLRRVFGKRLVRPASCNPAAISHSIYRQRRSCKDEASLIDFEMYSSMIILRSTDRRAFESLKEEIADEQQVMYLDHMRDVYHSIHCVLGRLERGWHGVELLLVIYLLRIPLRKLAPTFAVPTRPAAIDLLSRELNEPDFARSCRGVFCSMIQRAELGSGSDVWLPSPRQRLEEWYGSSVSIGSILSYGDNPPDGGRMRVDGRTDDACHALRGHVDICCSHED